MAGICQELNPETVFKTATISPHIAISTVSQLLCGQQREFWKKAIGEDACGLKDNVVKHNDTEAEPFHVIDRWLGRHSGGSRCSGIVVILSC